MSSIGEPVVTPGPEGETGPVRSPTPRYRRPALIVLAALAVVLVLNVIEVKLVEDHSTPTRPTRLGGLANDMGPTPQDMALSRVVADDLVKTQTDPAAWSHVTRVLVLHGRMVILQVDTSSAAVVERVCKQARRYVYAPSYSPKLRRLWIYSSRGQLIIGLDGKNDGCVASRADSP